MLQSNSDYKKKTGEICVLKRQTISTVKPSTIVCHFIPVDMAQN